MTWQTIVKDRARPGQVAPNMEDYDEARRTFSWDQARQELLDRLPDGGINIAHEAVDRHAVGPRASKLAIRWLGKHGQVQDFTFAQLRRLTNRFANVLADLGIGAGDTVFLLCGRVPGLYVSALGALKRRAVVSPLFSAFGPEPIAARVNLGGGKLLITTEALRKKVEPIRDRMPALERVVCVDGDELAGLMTGASDDYTIPPTDPEQPALLHFTSGTTGAPKGALHVHDAVVVHAVTGKLALDFHLDDVFWCTADPGWVTGTSYGIIAPLVCGITSIVDEAEFDAERWYSILRDQRVTVWYTAPTAVRMLMRVGADFARGYDLGALRFAGSVGEPLNPEAVVWGQEVLGSPFHDNWWQTETGGIMIANYASMDVRPGSMGKPLPGVDAAIVRRDSDGSVHEVTDPDTDGELALRPGWPSMFRGYVGAEDRYRECFAGGFYLTGDLARRDADGYFWFVGRADDVIKSAGHLIGPFEVESVLLEHPAVAEVGVIGVPDPVVGEVVKAFVELNPGYPPFDELRRELRGFARKRLGPAVAPREIEFCATAPRTRSGKIMRRLLRARELGLPEGDLSTLER